jgi:hypothetical protein
MPAQRLVLCAARCWGLSGMESTRAPASAGLDSRMRSAPWPALRDLPCGTFERRNSSSASRSACCRGSGSSCEGNFRRGIGDTFSVAVVQNEAREILGERTLKADPFRKRTWRLLPPDLEPWAGPRVARRLRRVGDLPPRALRRAWWRGPKSTLAVPQTTGPAAPALEPPASWMLPRRTS